MSKLEETSVFRKILSILHLAMVFYIINIKKIFDLSKNEEAGYFASCEFPVCELQIIYIHI